MTQVKKGQQEVTGSGWSKSVLRELPLFLCVHILKHHHSKQNISVSLNNRSLIADSSSIKICKYM